MNLLTEKQQQSYEHFEENFKEKYNKDKKYCKVWDHCCYTGEYRGAPHSICNLTFSVPNEMSKVFHNGSDCDYHFIIKELAKKIEGQFTSLGKNTEKYTTFSFSIEKEVTRIDKNGKEITNTISYRLQFVNCARFMANLLSSFVNNFAEGVHKIKCKNKHNKKQCKKCGIKYKDCNCFLEYTNFKDDLIEYKCLCCNKN